MSYAHKCFTEEQLKAWLQVVLNRQSVNLYLIFDGAAVPSDDFKLIYSGFEKEFEIINLFSGTVDECILESAPWLVCIDQLPKLFASRSFERLSELNQTLSCMSFLATERPVSELKSQLQFLSDIQMRNGKNALLRYYDPRIVPTFLLIMEKADVKINELVKYWVVFSPSTKQYIVYYWDAA